jgi:hypothetical protein
VAPFALPFAVLGRLAGADLTAAAVHDRIEKWAGAWSAAGVLGLFWLLARRLAGPRPAAWATWFLAAGSTLFSVCGQGLWQHNGVAFWMLLALDVEFRRARGPAPGGAALQGLACAMMLACRPTAALVVAPLGVWLLVRSPRRAVRTAAASCLAYAPWAALYGWVYGSPLGPSGSFLQGGWNWTWPSANALAATLVSPGRGLLLYQPWLLAGLAGAALVRFRPLPPTRGEPRGWRLFCVAVFLLHLVLIACYRGWWGGHSWGSRYLAEVLPLLALLCLRPLAALTQRRAWAALLTPLLLLSFAVHAVAVYAGAGCWNGRIDIDRRPDMVWSWSRPPFLEPWLRPR